MTNWYLYFNVSFFKKLSYDDGKLKLDPLKKDYYPFGESFSLKPWLLLTFSWIAILTVYSDGWHIFMSWTTFLQNDNRLWCFVFISKYRPNLKVVWSNRWKDSNEIDGDYFIITFLNLSIHLCKTSCRYKISENWSKHMMKSIQSSGK